MTSTTDVHCDLHNWFFESTDYCPECKGAQDERARIVALLEQADSACSPWAIALIKGEK